MADEFNPHRGANLDALDAALAKLEPLAKRTLELGKQNQSKLERLVAQEEKLAARLAASERAAPFRAVATSPSGNVRKVLAHGATEEEALAAGRGAIAPRGTSRTVVQANPKYDPEWVARQQEQLAATRNAVTAERAQTLAKQQGAEATLQRVRAEQQATAALLAERKQQVAGAPASAALTRARQEEAAALRAQARGAAQYAYPAGPQRRPPAGLLPAAGQTANLPLSPYRSGTLNEARLKAERDQALADAVQARTITRPGTSAPLSPYLPLGGGRQPPPPPPRPTAAAGGADDPGRQARINQAVEQGRLGWQRNTAAIAENDDRLRRHGALTTEFIAAAARGEAGYREWGYQIGATAGKFAGWTAVSIPVFAALDGIRLMGKGALESASGVNQLQRVLGNVNSDDAQQSFRDLSREFNVGPDVAARAVYLAAQRFKNLDDAVDAARASLAAFKTGEVDVDTAMQGLNATAAAFGLRTGKSVITTFDQVNQAQNQLGASIPDLLGGLARAGGAFKNAGGDVQGLITLLTSARLAAGRSGPQAATAIQRSAGYYLRPSNQAALRGFGINAQLPFYRPNAPSVLGQAVDVTRKLLRDGRTADVQKLAAALSSPQFASMFVPILRASALGTAGALQTIAPIVSRDASKDSAAIELKTLLASPTEQLAAFGNQLQRTGSAIGQSGLVVAATSSAAGLGLFLRAVEGTLNTINALPPALQALTVLGVAKVGGQALGRRFGIGEGSEGLRNLAFGRSPEQAANFEVRKRLREQGEYLKQQQVGLAERGRQAYLQQSIAARRYADAQAGPVPGETPDAHGGRLAASKARLEATQAAAYAAQEEVGALDLIARDQLRLSAAYKEAAAAGRVLHFATEEQIYAARTSRLPATEAPTRARGAINYISSVERATDKTQGAAVRARAYSDAFKQAESASARMGIAASAVGASAQGAGSAFRGAGGSLLRMARGLGRTIGPLGGLLLAVEAASIISSKISEQDERQKTALDKARSPARSAEEQQRKLDQAVQAHQRQQDEDTLQSRLALARRLAIPVSAGYQVARHAPVLGGVVKGAEHLGRKALSSFGLVAADTSREDQATIDQADEVTARQRENALRLLQGRPLIKQTGADVQFQLRGVAAETGRTVKQRMNDFDRLLKEVEISPFIDAAQAATLRARIDSARFSSPDVEPILASLSNLGQVSVEQVDKDLDSLAKLAQAPGGKLQQVQQAFTRGVLGLAAHPLTAKSGVDQIANYNALAQKTAQDVVGIAQQNLQQSLALAKGQGDIDRAYSTFFSTVSRGDNPFLAGLQRRKANLTRQRAKLQSQASQAQGLTRTTGVAAPNNTDTQGRADVFSPTAGISPATVGLAVAAPLIDHAKRAADAKTKAGQQLSAVDKALAAVGKAIEALMKPTREQQWQQHQAIASARAQIGQYAFSPGTARDAYLIAQAGAATRYAIAKWGRGSVEALSAAAAEQAAQSQLVQDQYAQIQSKGALAASQSSDPLAQARGGASTLGQLLTFARAHPTEFGPAAVDDLMTQINQANQGIAEQLKAKAEEAEQNARDLISANSEYRQSLTDDPIKIARIKAKEADDLVKHGHFKNDAERLRALANRNTARRDVETTVNDRKLENLDYQHDIGNLSDQAFLAAMQRQLAILKKGSEAYRTLRMRIGRFKHDIEKTDSSQYDLDVGNIRLPTSYEIRRTIAAAGAARAGHTSNSTVTNVTINGAKHGAAEEFRQVLAKSVPGFNASARAASRR